MKSLDETKTQDCVKNEDKNFDNIVIGDVVVAKTKKLDIFQME